MQRLFLLAYYGRYGDKWIFDSGRDILWRKAEVEIC